MVCYTGAGPLACATACATLDVIKEEKLLDNATARGAQLASVCFTLALSTAKGKLRLLAQALSFDSTFLSHLGLMTCLTLIITFSTQHHI